MNKVVLGITGHRMLAAEEVERIRPVITKAIQNIMFTVGEHDSTVSFTALSPLAEGADTLFAEVALSLGLELDILLPFEKDEYLKGFSSDQARLNFDKIYSKVNPQSIRVLTTKGNKEVDQLFLNLGHRVVDESDWLIAIWNEKEGKGKGGTADIVNYATGLKKNVIIINPEDAHLFINYINPHNHDHKGSRDIINPAVTNHLAAYIQHRQSEFDKKAVETNKKYRRLWTTGFILGILEVLAFAITVTFHMPLWLNFLFASIEFFSIVIIVLLVFFGGSKRLHHAYVHNRIIAERLRIKRFFSELGFRLYSTSVSPIYFSFNQKPEFDILDSTIRLINISGYSSLSFEEKRDHIESKLIMDQYKYHERKKEKFIKRNNQYKNIRQFLFLLFIAAVGLHYFEVANIFCLSHGIQVSSYCPHIFHIGLFEDVLLFLVLFIPPTIAACEALKYLYEWEKIINLSIAMSVYFRDKEKKLKATRTDQDLEILLNTINRDMLTENLDWEKYMQDKNEVPT